MAYLYMVMLGCRPPGRLTEQHDIFFGIGETMADLIPGIKTFWPEAKGKIHVDAWRQVRLVNGHAISLQPIGTNTARGKERLYFINLGGYKQGEFDEYHYKMLTVAPDISLAIKASKQTAFYKHVGFQGAVSHVDDKYGVDVDEWVEVKEALSEADKNRYELLIQKAEKKVEEDALHIGYFKLTSFF